MNKSVFKMVEEFNTQVTKARRYEVLDRIPEEEEWINALLEEIEEYKNSDDIVKKIDAIMDLIYYAAGGLCRHGINSEVSEKIFEKIHNCNMNKKKGVRKNRPKELIGDAVKPEDWIGPEEYIKQEINKLKNKDNINICKNKKCNNCKKI